ncbi:MAG: cytochrome c maturation protein CcmE [Chloroflexota bacterium]|nr:MAG: cytochrome c maturation protein CcmE [Chloroflexota bacterium]
MYNTQAAEGVASPRVKRKSLLARKKFLIGSLVVVLGIAYLVYSGIQSTMMYYLTPSELLAQGPAAYGEQLRLSGLVKPDSVQSEPKTMTLRFTVMDEKAPGTTMPVVYKGVVPDSFKPDAEVVLEGKLSSEGVFEANTLLAKCPTKYVPGT